MQTEQLELVREVMRATTTPAMGDVELGDIVTKLSTTVMEVLNEKVGADAIDRMIFDLHYRRRMSFSELASEIGITDIDARARWWRLLSTVADNVAERARSEREMASVLRFVLADPEAFRFVVPLLLSVTQAEPHGGLGDPILARTIETFGSREDALRWLSDSCPALNAHPLDLVADPGGLQDVENVLGCIDHGMIF
ncbi:MAG TPA: MbcA/ParS/Xre antitoxin family protein [Bryobacteraceae bacterium]|nr:MbcA/ParS/Xre antitoxin family protein [Bryobacteraceae bacterium]